MASTFRRNTKGKTTTTTQSTATTNNGGSVSSSFLSTLLPGTKPSAGGIRVTSTGLRDWDQILGSGQPLGTCVLLEQDRWTKSLAITLIKYWCAQAISHGQDLVIPVLDVDDDDEEYDQDWSSSDWNSPVHSQEPINNDKSVRKEIESIILQNLPNNLNVEKERRKQAAIEQQLTDGAGGTMTVTPLEALQEGDDEDEEETDGSLKIAWQYKKDVQRQRQGGVLGGEDNDSKRFVQATSDTFCHSFDLQGRLSKQMNVTESSRIVNLKELTNRNPLEYFRELLSLLPMNGKTVSRLLLYEPKISLLRTALPLLLSEVRQKKLPVVILVAVKPWRHERTDLLSLHRTMDVVLQAEGFASRKAYPPPSEFRMYQGLLRIPKATTAIAATAHGGGHFADLTTTKRVTSDLYGLKRDRRKLHIQLLHIPPEDYAEGGGSVGGGGVRSGAGRIEKTTTLGCASSGGGALDF